MIRIINEQPAASFSTSVVWWVNMQLRVGRRICMSASTCREMIAKQLLACVDTCSTALRMHYSVLMTLTESSGNLLGIFSRYSVTLFNARPPPVPALMWCHPPSSAEDSDIPPPPPPTQGRFEIVLDNDMIARLDLTPAHDVLQKYVGLGSLGEMSMRIFLRIDHISSNMTFNSLAA